jgi:hypothetical protein
MGVQVLQRMALSKPGKALPVLAIVLALGGCAKSDGDPPAPVDCKEGPDAIETALARAPARVEVGSTPLSECFTRGVSSSDLQQVGASYVTVATRLAEQARRQPDGLEALRLGYLVGAARRGVADTQGVHEELMRRIEQELIGVNTRSASYLRGFEAGRTRG